jgi:hypothetical protein
MYNKLMLMCATSAKTFAAIKESFIHYTLIRSLD